MAAAAALKTFYISVHSQGENLEGSGKENKILPAKFRRKLQIEKKEEKEEGSLYIVPYAAEPA